MRNVFLRPSESNSILSRRNVAYTYPYSLNVRDTKTKYVILGEKKKSIARRIVLSVCERFPSIYNNLKKNYVAKRSI